MKNHKMPLYNRISISWLSLASGIFLSSGLGILTNVMMSKLYSYERMMFSVIGLLLFSAAISFFIIATTLEEPKTEWSNAGSEPALWNKIVGPHLRKLNYSLTIGSLCVGAAAVLMTIMVL